METTFKTYAAKKPMPSQRREAVAPEMLMDRWMISKKELLKIVKGHHRSGVHLPALRFGSKTIRFRLADVVRVEYELYG